jgi:hypothetical protein
VMRSSAGPRYWRRSNAASHEMRMEGLRDSGLLAVALDELKAEGVPVNNADLVCLGAHATRELKRFRNHPTQFDPEPLTAMSLPS